MLLSGDVAVYMEIFRKIYSAVFESINYKQTNKQTNIQTFSSFIDIDNLRRFQYYLYTGSPNFIEIGDTYMFGVTNT